MSTISTPRRHRSTSIKARRDAQMREDASAVRLTLDGRRLMVERLDHLREVLIPALVPLLVDRERDERYTAEFERLTAEARWLDNLVATSLTVEPTSGSEVEIGSLVRLGLAAGEQEWVRPVHPVEAFLDDERISATSPLSQAILGASVGETVTVRGPGATWRCRVLEVRTTDDRELVGALG